MLNKPNVASTPALNAGIIVNRGTSTNTFIRWAENVDEWGWSDNGTTTYFFDDLRQGLITTNTTFGTVNTNITNTNSNAINAYGQANAAYGAANNRVLKAGDTMTGQLNISSGGLLVTGNSNFDSGTLFVDSVNDRIGIGTTIPGYKLDILGAGRAYQDASAGAAPLIAANFNTGSNTTKAVSVLFQGKDTVSTLKEVGQLWAYPVDVNWVNAGLQFWTRSGDSLSERMRLDNAGNLGIGTTTPRGNLDVGTATASAITRSIHLGYSAADFYGFRLTNFNTAASFGAGNFLIQRGTTAAWVDDFAIDNNGNVGIGTSTPSLYSGYKSITLAGGATGGVVDISGSGGITSGGCQISARATDVSIDAFGPSGGSASFLAFRTGTSGSVAERARITSGGDLCVGSTEPGNAGTRNISIGNPGTTVGGLQLWSTTSGTHYVQFGDSASGGAPYSGAIGYTHTDNALLFYTNQSLRATLDSVGNFALKGAAGTYSLDTTFTVASYANGATVDFPSMSGMIIANDQLSTGYVTIWLVGGGNTTAAASHGGTPVGSMAYNAAVAGYRWTNNSGETRSVAFAVFRTRNTA